MTSFAQLYQQCVLLDGYQETRDAQHPKGNVTKIWAELDPPLQGAFWCLAGVSWLWLKAGHPFPAIDRRYGVIYSPDLWTYARHAGLWDTSGHYEPGDTLLWDFVSAGYPDHGEILIQDSGSTGMRVFGCNVMPDGGTGSPEWNGGGAHFKRRYHGAQLMGAVKSSLWLSASPTPAPAPRKKTNPFIAPLHTVVPGQRDYTTNGNVHWVQWAVGVACDGVFGPATKHAVEMFQAHHRLVVDGIVGSSTGAALRLVTH